MTDESCGVCHFLRFSVYAKRRPHLVCRWCRDVGDPTTKKTHSPTSAARQGGKAAQRKIRETGYRPMPNQEGKNRMFGPRKRAA